jgi:hypothetical protein
MLEINGSIYRYAHPERNKKLIQLECLTRKQLARYQQKSVFAGETSLVIV